MKKHDFFNVYNLQILFFITDAWVGFSDSVMQGEEFVNLKQAVNDAIEKAGFNLTEFVDVKTNASENFDFCIPSNITSQ